MKERGLILALVIYGNLDINAISIHQLINQPFTGLTLLNEKSITSQLGKKHTEIRNKNTHRTNLNPNNFQISPYRHNFCLK